MFILQPHNSNLALLEPPRASVALDGDFLVLTFEHRAMAQRFVSEQYDQEFKNWGLWEHDVFEAFLTRSMEQKLPYLEAQVSPLNQKLALVIEEPRKSWHYPEHCPFTSETILKDGVWKSVMKISLSLIPGEGSKIFGNLHAILGANRQHFSLNVNVEEAPDFHRPELFQKLAELK